MIEPYEHSYVAESKPLGSLSVYNVGIQKCRSDHRVGPGIRDHYLIHHVLKGRGYFEYKGKVYDLKAGDTFLIYPNEESLYYADENDPWEYTWVGFAGLDAYALLSHTDFTREHPVLEQNDISSEIKEKISEVYAVKGSSFTDAVMMTGKLYNLIAFLMAHGKNVPDATTKQEFYVEKATQYIEEHYSYPISIEEIADYVGICHSYMYRLFQKYHNQSPKEYLMNYRIQRAQQLLMEGRLSIATIAHSVGFEDRLYFSKAFKKCTGKKPSDCLGHKGVSNNEERKAGS